MGNVSFIDGHIDEPKGLTDNEIINVLEICVNKTDVFVIHHNAETREYDKISIKDILGVINRQKAEIENYKQIAENQQSVSMDKEVEIKRLKAEVERLSEAIYQSNITSEIKIKSERLHQWKQLEQSKRARAEAVKGFAERIDEYLKRYSHIHKHADEVMHSTEEYADGTPMEMVSVWEVLSLIKYGLVDYETMNTLQDNIETLAIERVLTEIEKDFRLFKKEMVGEDK